MKQNLSMGAFCAPVGVLVGALFTGSAGAGWGWLPLLAGLSAFASAALCWGLFVARRPRPTVVRGALAGAAAALLAHYGTFYLLIVRQNISHWVYGTVSSLGEPPVGLWDGLVGAVAFTLFSYLFIGWFTIPVGALIGGVYARRLGRSEPPPG